MKALTLSPDTGATKGMFLALAGYATFSVADTIIKILGSSYSSVQIAWLASLIMTIVVPLYARSWRVFIPRSPLLTITRGLINTVTILCAVTAFSLLPLADAYALIFAAPMFVTMLAGPVLGEKIGVHRWFAVVVGFIGVLVIVRPGTAPLGLGHAAALGAALASALSLLVTRKVSGRESIVNLLATSALTTCLIVTPVALSTFVMPTLPDTGLFALIGLGLLGGQLSLICALRISTAGAVVPFQYTQMLWALVYGATLFGQWPDRFVLIGATIVAASGLYILMREHIRNRPLTPAQPNAGIIAGHPDKLS